MLDPTELAAAFTEAGITRWYGVPDSLMSSLIAEIVESPLTYTTATVNEGAAVAAAAGHFLATGEIAGVYLQNSGVGNALNPLVSLAHRNVYSIPIVLVVGWRGYPGTTDEPQHMTQGQATRPMLEAAGVRLLELSGDETLVKQTVQRAHSMASAESGPIAILVPPGILPRPPVSQAGPGVLLTRESAIEVVLDSIPTDTVVLATTGKMGRELFELRGLRQENDAADFLSIGSMGHVLAVALGMATARPERQIVVLDGDGSAAMHLGTQLTVANAAPVNLLHILFNNGSYESVGGQPTDLSVTEFTKIAEAAGYRSAVTVRNESELADATKKGVMAGGPSLVEVLIESGSRADLGRPSVTRRESRDAVRQKFDS
jgi:phosphonopyruvate decarboxylase